MVTECHPASIEYRVSMAGGKETHWAICFVGGHPGRDYSMGSSANDRSDCRNHVFIFYFAHVLLYV